MISAQQIKELRDKTGAGISDIKKALEESKGDTGHALEIIEQRLGNLAGKRAGRATGAGIVEAYIHSTGRVGVLIELFCETDFVARNAVFKEFAHDLALHIAAMRPLYLAMDAVPADLWQREKKRFAEEAAGLKKPANIVEQIVDGKLKAHFGSMTLLEQSFVKDADKTVGELLKETIGKFGENIKIWRFSRFEI